MELKLIKEELEDLKRNRAIGTLTPYGCRYLKELNYVVEQLSLQPVSESYIKCWNCKQFEQTGTNTMGNEVGNCKLNECKVSHPKWQKCGEYEQCGNFR